MDQITRKLPEHYYDTMYLDGFTPEEIYMTNRRDMLAALTDPAPEMNVNISTEVSTK